MNTAIIVAAGSGSRFQSDTPKQFLEVLGKPILAHTLERFEECGDVDEIVLVLSPDQAHKFEERFASFGFRKIAKTVVGGATRAESVHNGLASLDARTEIVAVHDGARPVVSVEEISRTIGRAVETGAACLVAPVVDTIKHVEDGYISRTLDRSRLRRALTPQAFAAEILRRAFREAVLSENVTDECFLVEKLGVPIAAVEGNPRNIKITHPQDLKLAELYLRQVD